MIRKKRLFKFVFLCVFVVLFDLYTFGILAAFYVTLSFSKEWFNYFLENYAYDPLNVIQSILYPSTDLENQIFSTWRDMQIVGVPIFGYALLIATTKLKLWRSKPKDMHKYGSHGTARWATRSEKEEWYLRDNLGVGIGLLETEFRKTKEAYHPIKSRLNQNICVVGGSGSNKSTSETIPMIFDSIRLEESIVVNDPKGEVYDITATELRENGYDVKVLNFVNPEKSNQWNPLDFVETSLDILNLSHTIIANTSNPNSGSDEMWKNGEQALLQAVILYVKKHLPEEYHNLTQVLSLGLREGSTPGYLNSLFEPLKDGDEAKEMYKIFCAAEPKVRSGIAIGFATRLQLFVLNDIAAMTSWSDFDLKAVGRKKVAIFLIIPDYNTTFVPIISLFHSQLFEILYKDAHENRGTLERPVRILRDEFANTGKIPSYKEKIATVRSRRIYETIFVQEISQLKTMYPGEEWQTVLGNFDTLIYLGKVELETAEYISKRMGSKTILVDGHSESSGPNDSESDQENYQGRELLKPDEILGFDLDHLIVLQKGRYPVVMKKRYYFDHPIFKNAKRTSWIELPDRVLEKPELFIPTPNSVDEIEEQLDGLEFPDEIHL